MRRLLLPLALLVAVPLLGAGVDVGGFATSVASNGGDFLVAVDGGVAQIAADGTRLRQVALPAGGVLGFGANIYLYASTDGAKLALQRLAPNGDPIGNAVIIDEQASQPAVGSDGRDFLVVWAKGKELRGALVTPAGEVEQVLTIVTTTSTAESMAAPHVASDGQRYVVTYAVNAFQHEPPTPASPITHAVAVSPDGAVGEPIALTESCRCNEPPPAPIASNGHGFFAVIGTDGQFLSADGLVLHLGARVALGSTPDPLVAGFAGVAWNGASYTAVWSFYGPTDSMYFVGLTHVAVDGTVEPARTTAIRTYVSQRLPPLLAANAAGAEVIVLNETATSASSRRAFAYRGSDVADRVAPPARPILLAAVWYGPAAIENIPSDGHPAILQWKEASNDARGFIILRNTALPIPDDVAYVPAGSTTYALRAAEPPWSFMTYSVVAWNEAGSSAASNQMHTSAAPRSRAPGRR